MRFKCYFALLVFAATLAAQPIDSQIDQHQTNLESIDQDELQRKEASILREDFQRDFYPWVQQELAQSHQNSMFESKESFLLQLAPQQEHEFRWPIKVQHAYFKFKIRVFTQESGDDIVIIKNPCQSCRIQVFWKSSYGEIYQSLANVYLQKMAKILGKDEGAFIMVRNMHSITVIIEVSLETQPTKIDAGLIAKNDHFSVPAAKLEAILSEMRVTESNRKWQYKWQWGFLQREEHYEQQMLKLIGGETIIILATAIVQMYCIKALLDNNNVI